MISFHTLNFTFCQQLGISTRTRTHTRSPIMRSVLLIVSLVLVLSFAEAAGHHHPSRSPSTEIVRSKRLARWENTIDAIKCSLKIVAKEVASKCPLSFFKVFLRFPNLSKSVKDVKVWLANTSNANRFPLCGGGGSGVPGLCLCVPTQCTHTHKGVLYCLLCLSLPYLFDFPPNVSFSIVSNVSSTSYPFQLSLCGLRLFALSSTFESHLCRQAIT